MKPIRQLEGNASRFYKPARLIELVQSSPYEVIAKVFDQVFLTDLTNDLLPNWLHVAVISMQNPYSDEDGREILYEFYEYLLPLMGALYVISGATPMNRPLYLTGDQRVNPSEMINQFFHKFSIDYVRRELYDLVDTGIGFDGSYPKGFSGWLAWMSYNRLQCLTEAAYQLYINQQMQSVTVKLYIPGNL